MIMETKKMTNTGSLNVEGLKVDYTAVLNIVDNTVSVNGYVIKGDKQVGMLMYKSGEQFYHTYNNPDDVTTAQMTAVFAALLAKIDESKTELSMLSV